MCVCRLRCSIALHQISFVAFICAASVTLGAGPIKAAAAFLFFNTGLIGYSAYLTHKYVTHKN